MLGETARASPVLFLLPLTLSFAPMLLGDHILNQGFLRLPHCKVSSTEQSSAAEKHPPSPTEHSPAGVYLLVLSIPLRPAHEKGQEPTKNNDWIRKNTVPRTDQPP